MKSIKKIVIVLAVAILMFSLVLATSYAISTPKNDKKDTGIVIDSKSKTLSYKITWNANGGKIGAKKTVSTNVKKGSKIGKLATIPKRSGYIFKGWYTKKSGGTKINKNIKPTKSITYYANWDKGSTSTSSKLVGHWRMEWSVDYRYNYHTKSFEGVVGKWFSDYYFYADGRFQYFTEEVQMNFRKIEGKYSVSNGKVYLKEMKRYDSFGTNLKENSDKFGVNYPKWNFNDGPYQWNDMATEYKFGSDKKGNFLQIAKLRNMDPPNSYTLSSADKFYKK